MSKAKQVLLKIVMTIFAMLPFIVGIVLSIILNNILWILVFNVFPITNAIHFVVLEKYDID